MLFFSLVFFSFGKNKKPTNSSQSLLSKLGSIWEDNDTATLYWKGISPKDDRRPLPLPIFCTSLIPKTALLRKKLKFINL